MVAAYKRNAGIVQMAQLLPFPLKHPPQRRTYAQKLGLKYEARAFVQLSLMLSNVSRNPAVKFRSEGKAFDEYCIPDAIAWNDDRTIGTIFEIKLRHTGEAWKQLNNLYLPVVQKLYPEAHLNLCEICQTYDKTVLLPGDFEIIEKLPSWTQKRQHKFGIFLWSGR